MTYKTLSQKFKENNLNNNFGKYYYIGKYTQRKCVKFIPKINSYILVIMWVWRKTLDLGIIIHSNNGRPTENAYMLANIEMIIVIIMMGVGIGTLIRKVVR